MTPEEGQRKIDEWFENLPNEVQKDYSYLERKVSEIQTFDLISYSSYYNHLHSSENYQDYRDGRNYFVPEVLSLLCLKNHFIDKTSLKKQDFLEEMMEIQERILSYCTKFDALENWGKKREDNVLHEISRIITSEEKTIRNPGLPEHHFIFSKRLFDLIENEVESLCGFSISDSILIRKSIGDLIQSKCDDAFSIASNKGNKLAREVFKFKKNRKFSSKNRLTKKQLEELSTFSNLKVKNILRAHFIEEMFFNFSEVYTFSIEELTNFTKLSQQKIKSFLNTFSIGFPSLKPEDPIHTPVSLLKSKPILENNGKYLVPSYPLLTWAVEDVVEEKIKKSNQLAKRFPELKHNFLIDQGLTYFSKLLPTASLVEANLYYQSNGNRCETDGIIVYDKVLFIIEAKGNRISSKAKKGHRLKTEDHLKDIIKDSYSQGIRTLKYLEEKPNAIFKTEKGKEITLELEKFTEVIITSLTIEPIGNLSMAIKKTNDLGYFSEDHFPWIISLYDLIVFSDLLVNPFLLIHYIKRRYEFLSHQHLTTYEELDLLSYFLFNGLYIEGTLKQAEEEKTSFIQFAPNTDTINDFYMYKFGHKSKFTPKPSFFLPDKFLKFLSFLDKSEIPNRVEIALLILRFNKKSIQDLIKSITKVKKSFASDREIHDCSIHTISSGGIGITFMTGVDKQIMDKKLHNYCHYKMNQLNSNIWIGLGDTELNINKYYFKSSFFEMKKDIL